MQGHFAVVLAESAPGLSPEEVVEACGLFAGKLMIMSCARWFEFRV